MAVGDDEVAPYGAHLLGREIGTRSVGPAYRPIWGIDVADQPFEDSLVELTFPGVPEVRKTNVLPEDLDMNPHDDVRKLDVANNRTDQFLRTGIVEHARNGVCDPS